MKCLQCLCICIYILKDTILITRRVTKRKLEEYITNKLKKIIEDSNGINKKPKEKDWRENRKRQMRHLVVIRYICKINMSEIPYM